MAADLSSRYLTDRAVLKRHRGIRTGPGEPTRSDPTDRTGTRGGRQPACDDSADPGLEIQGLVTRLADPDDGRAALVAITQAGRVLLDERTLSRRERLATLRATLSSEQRWALGLSVQVALPILGRLLNNAESLAHEGTYGQGRPDAGPM
jgi:hypothetical protein